MQRFLAYLVAALARIWLFPVYWLAGFAPRRDDIWVFGSWGGHRYADNAAAFFEYCHDHVADHVNLVWISRRRSVVRQVRSQGLRAYWRWSPRGIYCCLRAGVYLFDCFSKDINFWLSRRATKVCLWSGVPLKVFERSIDAPSSRYYQMFHGAWGIRHVLQALMPWHMVRPDLLIAASDEARHIMCNGFDVPMERVAVTGLPRNDALFHPIAASSPELPDRYKDALRDERKVFLYLPTIRESGKPFMAIDWQALDRVMQETNGHFFVKLHPAEQGRVSVDLDRVTLLARDVDVYDILPHADILVSDYSSIIWDYMLLNRPVVYYLPDHDEFVTNSRSLNFDVLEIAAGPVCRNSPELVDSLRTVLDPDAFEPTTQERYRESAARLNRYADDRSSERTLHALRKAGIYVRPPTDGADGPLGLLGTEMSKLLGGSAFIFLCRVAGAGLAFATQIMLARLMGAAELGVYVWAFSWMILLSTVSGLGLHEAAIRFVGEGIAAGSGARVRGYVRRSGQIVFGVALILVALGIALTSEQLGLVSAEVRRPLIVALVAVPAYSFLEFQTSVANGMSWFRLSFLPNNVIRPLVFLAFLAAVWLGGRSIDATLALETHWLAIALVFLAVGVLLWRAMQASLPMGGYEYRTRAWLKTSLPLLGVSTVNAFFPEIMVVLISGFLSSADVAIFNAGFRTAVLIVFGLHAIDSFMAPQTAQLLAAGDMSTLAGVVNRATRVRFWGALAGTLVLALAGPWLLGLFGPEFVSAYPVLLILAATQTVRGAAGPTVRLLSLSGHQNQMLAVFAAALAIAIILVVILVPTFGVIGAAVSASAATIIWSLWLRSLVSRYLGIRPALTG